MFSFLWQLKIIGGLWQREGRAGWNDCRLLLDIIMGVLTYGGMFGAAISGGGADPNLYPF